MRLVMIDVADRVGEHSNEFVCGHRGELFRVIILFLSNRAEGATVKKMCDHRTNGMKERLDEWSARRVTRWRVGITDLSGFQH